MMRDFGSVTRELKGKWITGQLEELLLNQLGDDRPMDYARYDAYLHPNGFWKVRVSGMSQGKAQLRLHYWPPGSPEGDTHDHSWPYASLVLAGAALEETFREDSAGELFAALSYRKARDGEGFGLGGRSNGVRLQSDGVRAWVPGDLSGGESSHIHRFYPAPGQSLLTMVLMGEPTGEPSRVFRPNFQSFQAIAPEPLSAVQIREVMVAGVHGLQALSVAVK